MNIGKIGFPAGVGIVVVGFLGMMLLGCSVQSTGTSGVTISPSSVTVHEGGTATLEVTAHPFSGHEVHYMWEVHGGSGNGSCSPTDQAQTVYTAPGTAGKYEVHVTVTKHEEEGAHAHSSLKSLYLPLDATATDVATGEVEITVEEEGHAH